MDRAAKMNAEHARKLAKEAVREAHRAEAPAWSWDTPIWKLEAALKCRSCLDTALPAAGPHDQAHLATTTSLLLAK